MDTYTLNQSHLSGGSGRWRRSGGEGVGGKSAQSWCGVTHTRKLDPITNPGLSGVAFKRYWSRTPQRALRGSGAVSVVGAIEPH
jgi:hypothetical protein